MAFLEEAGAGRETPDLEAEDGRESEEDDAEETGSDNRCATPSVPSLEEREDDGGTREVVTVPAVFSPTLE